MRKNTDLDIGQKLNGQFFNTHLLRVIQLLSIRGMYAQPTLQNIVNHFTNLINV